MSVGDLFKIRNANTKIDPNSTPKTSQQLDCKQALALAAMAIFPHIDEAREPELRAKKACEEATSLVDQMVKMGWIDRMNWEDELSLRIKKEPWKRKYDSQNLA